MTAATSGPAAAGGTIAASYSPAGDGHGSGTAAVAVSAAQSGSPRPRRNWSVLRQVLVAMPAPILLVLLWDLGVRQGWTLPLDIRMAQVPSPGAVAVRLADVAVGGIINDPFSGELLRHTQASVVRVFSGFGLAMLVAIPLGVLMGRSKLMSQLLEPTLNLIRPIPVTAWVPLALIIIGIGDRSTIFLVFLSAVFPILLNTISAVQHVPVRLLEAAAMLGTPKVQALYKVVIPAAVPGMISGLRVALGLAWVVLVVGETTGITVGLGAMITEAKEVSKTDLIVAGMVFIGLLGFLSDRLLVGLVKAVSRRRPILNNTP
ncbi:ABC transporter permease [Arthrobacter gengyunqii]|uniref:ABC transporter permease n=1 Tax=Arthrobacter gengyunqii TaxID=2886940 RepID=A0A9X1M2Y2_9MICC|nr:ABC transporter permease [Arthrobacter gengyunqii]MCC3270393.1 ABC transporter permease [Arthrobacter gengyunqii]UOY97587.1 ABC transporter permease [Arthrobacter gengyunqii]